MEIIKSSIEFVSMTPEPLKVIEKAGRTCYKSEDKITDGSAEKFVKMIIDRGHEAMIEFGDATYRVVCDRGVTHEIVRHRLASYAQESTRYVNYQKKGMQFIQPCFWSEDGLKYSRWLASMIESEKAYNNLIQNGANPQEARSVLPNSLKTEIVMKMNFREWRHFFKLRTSEYAHPQMREVADMLLSDIRKIVPVVFDKIG
jgi:thymidylate synthase (FAD)